MEHGSLNYGEGEVHAPASVGVQRHVQGQDPPLVVVCNLVPTALEGPMLTHICTVVDKPQQLSLWLFSELWGGNYR